MALFDPNDPQSMERFRNFIPQQMDQMIRQLIQLTQMSLPDGKQTSSEVERVFREFVDRALKDFRGG
ncbi:MAG: hypothetical protein ACXVBO_22800 [Isosphaeraceae bacterium]